MSTRQITEQDVIRALDVIGIIATRLADMIDELATSKTTERREIYVKDERDGNDHPESARCRCCNNRGR